MDESDDELLRPIPGLSFTPVPSRTLIASALVREQDYLPNVPRRPNRLPPASPFSPSKRTALCSTGGTTTAPTSGTTPGTPITAPTTNYRALTCPPGHRRLTTDSHFISDDDSDEASLDEAIRTAQAASILDDEIIAKKDAFVRSSADTFFTELQFGSPTIHSSLGDGNCFYRSVLSALTCSSPQQDVGFDQLRQDVATFLDEHLVSNQQFLEHGRLITISESIYEQELRVSPQFLGRMLTQPTTSYLNDSRYNRLKSALKGARTDLDYLTKIAESFKNDSSTFLSDLDYIEAQKQDGAYALIPEVMACACLMHVNIAVFCHISEGPSEPVFFYSSPHGRPDWGRTEGTIFLVFYPHRAHYDWLEPPKGFESIIDAIVSSKREQETTIALLPQPRIK